MYYYCFTAQIARLLASHILRDIDIIHIYINIVYIKKENQDTINVCLLAKNTLVIYFTVPPGSTLYVCIYGILFNIDL